MKGMHETFSRYDTAEYLKTKADIATYLEAYAEEAPNNAAFMLKALGTVARAHRLALARQRLSARRGPEPRVKSRLSRYP
jgi:probable addiction module antidote protein